MVKKLALDNDKFDEFILQWMKKEEATPGDIFQIQEGSGEDEKEISVNIPEIFYQDFLKKYPDYDLEETINAYIRNIIQEVLDKND